jgi:hypothetical protein
MDDQNPFKWRHFEAEIILLCVLAQLSGPRGNDTGAGSARGPHHDLPLGSTLCS